MKNKILAAVMLLLAGCVQPPPRPYSAGPGPYDTPSSSSSDPGRSSTTTQSRDASECERQAALSTAGSKAEAFNNCMKARRAPN
jgi:hypothetical protein